MIWPSTLHCKKKPNSVMIRLFKPGCIILLFLYLTSCGNEDYENTIPEDIPKYVINPLQATQQSIHGAVSNYDFIPLEIPSDVTIEVVRKVLLRDSNIYVLDTNNMGYRAKISVYDLSGSFQFIIDKSGQGPGEYELIHDFDVTDDNIIAISNSNILYYDRASGEHVNSISNNFDGARIQWAKFFDDNSGVFVAGRGRANRSKNHLKFFETDSNSIVNEAVPFPSHALILGGSYRFLFESYEGLNARPVNSNIVYSIQKNQGSISVEPRYSLNFGDLWIPESFLRTSFQNMDQIFTEGLHREYVHTVDLFETNKILYAAYTHIGDNFTYIYDKVSEQKVNISEFIENDIGWPLQPLTTYNEWIVGVTYPYELEGDSNTDPALQEIVNNSDNEGNPILILVNFALDQ